MAKVRIRAFFYLLTAFLLPGFLCAQGPADRPTPSHPWTMEQCINYAWNNNLQIKQAEVNQQISKNNLLQSKANFLPSVNGFASNTYNYGLTVNPLTNTFANGEVTDDQFVVSGNFTLFGGFQNINSLKQNDLTYRASTLDLQENKNTIALNIAQDYLQELLNKELLTEAQSQQTIDQAQVDKTKKLVDAGSLAKSNLLDVESQEANDEVNVVNAQTALDIAKLNLSQLLDLDSAQMLNIVTPDIYIPENSSPEDPEKVYTAALTNQPDVQSAQLKWQSAERSRAVSAGALYPKLSFVASLGTGYSTANVTTTPIATIDTLHTTLPGVGVLYPNYSYVTESVPFWTQLKNNKNESFGFQLNVPLFNKLQANIAWQNAKLNEQNAYYTYQESELNLRKTIQQAYADALGALNKYHAEEKSVASLQESFGYTQTKFNVGMATALDYNTAQINLAKAQSDLLQAKYNYVFKIKVLDFYEGKPLKL